MQGATSSTSLNLHKIVIGDRQEQARPRLDFDVLRSGEFLSCEVIGSTNAEQIGAITHEQSPNLSQVPPCLATTARRWSVDRARHEGLLARRKPLLIFLQGGGGFSERFGDFYSEVPILPHPVTC